MRQSLADLMNSFYGSGNWQTASGAVAGSGTDIVPAIAAAISNWRLSGNRGVIEIDAGTWAMKTALDPALVSGTVFQGEGSQASKIIYQSNEVAFNYSAANGYSGGGISGLSIMLDSDLGDSSAQAIVVRGDSQYQSDDINFSDIYITSVGGQSTWNSGIRVDGTARVTPQGARIAHWQNIRIFRCTAFAANFKAAVAHVINGLGTYVPNGVNGADVYFTGAGTHETNSYAITATGLNINGALRYNNCDYLHMQGMAGSVIRNATATHVSGDIMASTLTGTAASSDFLNVRCG